jgi:hypothetical protein
MRRLGRLSLAIVGTWALCGVTLAGDSCPSECVCIQSIAPGETKDGFDPERVAAAIANAPNGAPIVVRDTREFLLARALTKNKSLILLERTSSVPDNLRRLSQTPESVVILHNVPNTVEEAENIHRGRMGKISKQAVAEIRSQLSLVKGNLVDIATLRREGASLREVTLERLHSAKSGELVLLIAHNEDGALRLGDGSFLLASEVAESSPANVWVIGCNTLKQAGSPNGPVIGIGRELRYKDAIRIAEAIRLSAVKGNSYAAILIGLQRTSPVLIGIVGALLYLEFQDKEESK